MDLTVPSATGVAAAAVPSLIASSAQPPHVESYAIPRGSAAVQAAGVSEPAVRMGEDKDKQASLVEIEKVLGVKLGEIEVTFVRCDAALKELQQTKSRGAGACSGAAAPWQGCGPVPARQKQFEGRLHSPDPTVSHMASSLPRSSCSRAAAMWMLSARL